MELKTFRQRKNEYMKKYWIEHPAQYDAHKIRMVINKSKKRYVKIIDNMLNMIYAYFYRLEVMENGEGKIQSLNYNDAKEI